MILSYLIFLIFLLDNQGIYALSCKDHEGNGVDWSFAYRIPGQGVYAYKTSFKPKGWVIIHHDIDSPNSIFSKTFYTAYNSPHNYMYVMYNDRIPSGKAQKMKNLKTTSYTDSDIKEDISEKYGSSKGVLLWNEANAIWFMHSVPRFMPNFLNGVKLTFPTKHIKEGHIFLCLTVKYESILHILIRLMMMKVKVYGHRLYASSIFKSARSHLYPPMTKGAVTFDSHFHTSFGTFFNNLEYTVIIERNSQSILEKAKIGLRLQNDLTVKFGGYITNSKKQFNYTPLSVATSKNYYKKYHQVTLEIDRYVWNIDVDFSVWLISDDGGYFCIVYETNKVSNVVCIRNGYLRDSMRQMISIKEYYLPIPSGRRY